MKLVDDLKKVMEEHYQEVFDKPDWVMRDLPSMPREMFDEFVELVGPENVLVASGSIRQEKKGLEVKEFVRATVLISPEGFKNVREKLKKESS